MLGFLFFGKLRGNWRECGYQCFSPFLSQNQPKILRSLRKDVFERRMSTGSWILQDEKKGKALLPVDCIAQKRLCLSSVLIGILRNLLVTVLWDETWLPLGFGTPWVYYPLGLFSFLPGIFFQKCFWQDVLVHIHRARIIPDNKSTILKRWQHIGVVVPCHRSYHCSWTKRIMNIWEISS